MPLTQDRQYRALQEITVTQQNKKFDTECYVEGYAARYDPYILFNDAENNPIYERFERTAFDSCDMADIIFQYDHQGKVFARKSNNTLIVETDNIGLFICADLSKTEASRNMFEEIDTGLVTKMSWGFLPGEYHFDKPTRTLIHTKIKKIFDVSAVSIPANQDTEIYARNFANGEIDKVKQELLRAEQQRQKLTLKLKLGGF